MKLQLTSLKEYVFVNSAFKIQCYIVKKKLIQTVFGDFAHWE